MSSQKDSRNYAVMGDPAVRIPVAESPKETREVIVVDTAVQPPPTPAAATAPDAHSVVFTEAPSVIHTTIPMKDGRVYVELWRAHVAAVERAIAERS